MVRRRSCNLFFVIPSRPNSAQLMSVIMNVADVDLLSVDRCELLWILLFEWYVCKMFSRCYTCNSTRVYEYCPSSELISSGTFFVD
eukprot:2026943-Amphidinium_carterae.1